jgi:hypothetical protein
MSAKRIKQRRHKANRRVLKAVPSQRQQDFLARRLEEVAEIQPDVTKLREVLVNLGGKELVPPGEFDPDLPALLESGCVISGPVILTPMEESQCHKNVAKLWLEKKITGVCTGYGLTESDGLWRQHSWGVRSCSIIETTVERRIYFGIELIGIDLMHFIMSNARDHFLEMLPAYLASRSAA